ncbi:MAG: methionyl-tRNA formyltransferase [Candidatus Dormibacteria bacterium]
MLVVYAGSGAFALGPLRALAASRHRILAVLTAPDGIGDRGRPAARPVRDLAGELALPVLQPARLTKDDLDGALGSGAELLVVCAYGQLVRRPVLAAFPRGAVGVHPSLLPRHRGASPVAAAILAGDLVTGVTIYQMDERLDSGPILAAESLQIAREATTPTLQASLEALAARLLPATLDLLEEGKITPQPQSEDQATYAPRLSRADGRVTWDQSAEEIERRLRALQPWPGVTAELGGAEVKLLAGSALSDQGPAGPPESVVVPTASGLFQIDLVQPSGGRPMTAAAFMRGRRLPAEQRS